MLPIAAIAAGIFAMVMGATALSKGEVQISQTRTLQGRSATTAGVLILMGGIGIVLFALVGIPWLLR